ncbi:MAG: acetyl-CoA carboxylase carboxyltransferase subunit alpha [Proteobacteria bacterium]|jgi:acetyl-CoA carboxylase carboxyl transferase subunit alpha|nr:acetyl-CoA carboxylase carboxyltransferase subunit alpha [Alphaproteobacteria bacterium]NCC02734.1 acetyl-CoA carboxylase carboxyltransferase subunit alpha [Pseudomonadota bacterium]
MQVLSFEKPVTDLEAKIEELRHLSSDGDVNIADEVARLQAKVEQQLRTIYGKLTPEEKVQVARHPDRPQFLDYVEALITEFTPLAGDRAFADDRAVIGGLGRFNGQACMIIGQQRGHDTESRVKHNFGMANPEGYRKAQRLMHMADHFGLPILTFVDTAGAFPGDEAEARGQAEAIARSIEVCVSVKVPLISVVIGEGGSGGAIAIAAADRILMLEHAIYSVISPEGCASILWRGREFAGEAAKALRLTAQDLLQFGVIDAVIPEPLGGAHRLYDEVFASVRRELAKHLGELMGTDGQKLAESRQAKFLQMGKRL